MYPTFHDCTLLVIDFKTTPQNLQAGDLAVIDVSDIEGFAYNQIAHRVVDNSPEQLQFSTRGDNSSYYEFPSSIDGYFPYTKFDGKVTNYLNLPKFLCGT